VIKLNAPAIRRQLRHPQVMQRRLHLLLLLLLLLLTDTPTPAAQQLPRRVRDGCVSVALARQAEGHPVRVLVAPHARPHHLWVRGQQPQVLESVVVRHPVNQQLPGFRGQRRRVRLPGHRHVEQPVDAAVDPHARPKVGPEEVAMVCEGWVGEQGGGVLVVGGGVCGGEAPTGGGHSI